MLQIDGTGTGPKPGRDGGGTLPGPGDIGTLSHREGIGSGPLPR